MRNYLAILTVVMLCVTAMTATSATAQETDKRQEIAASQAPADGGQSFDDWVESTKHPTEWWSWGADLRLREVFFDNAVTLSIDDANDSHFERIRARWWSKFTPWENFEFNVRLMYEMRHWAQPDSREEWDTNHPIYFDHLNVKLSNLFDMPITLQVGRQDIILGDGWLVLEGTPLDGSRTIYFDAVRLTWDELFEETKLDLIYLDQAGDSDDRIPTINTKQETQIDQDERGIIAYLTNTGLVEDTELNGYFMWKSADAVTSLGDQGDIFTIGGRMEHTFNESWKLRMQGAHQFGDKARRGFTNERDLSAFGFTSRLTYFFQDEWNTQLRGTYEYLSGDDPGTTGTDEQWDTMWGRWPQFSELYVYSYIPETRIAEVTNLHRINVGLTFFPIEQIEMCADYHLLLADENPMSGTTGFSDDGDIRGHLFALLMRYKLNKHMYGHIVNEYLLPGDYYADGRNDLAVFLRGELTLVW